MRVQLVLIGNYSRLVKSQACMSVSEQEQAGPDSFVRTRMPVDQRFYWYRCLDTLLQCCYILAQCCLFY